MSWLPRESPFTDEEVETLMQAPLKQIDSASPWPSKCAPGAPDLASALATTPFCFATVVGGSAPYVNDYFRLFRTASDKSVKALVSRNPSLAKDVFPSMCEKKRTTIVDFIIAEKLADVNDMLPHLAKYKFLAQMHAMISDERITSRTLNQCLVDTCVSYGNHELFDLFFNDLRTDVVNFSNSALWIAVLHGCDEIVAKLLADERVQKCEDWRMVVWNAMRQRKESLARLIIDQPAARLSRMAIRTALGADHEWIRQHPKYFEYVSPTALLKKSIAFLNDGNERVAKKLLTMTLDSLEGREIQFGSDDNDDEYDSDEYDEWF